MNLPSQVNLRDLTNYILIGILYIAFGAFLLDNYSLSFSLNSVANDWIKLPIIVIAAYKIGVLVPGAIHIIHKAKDQTSGIAKNITVFLLNIDKTKDSRINPYEPESTFFNLLNLNIHKTFNIGLLESNNTERKEIYYLVSNYVKQHSSANSLFHVERLHVLSNFLSRITIFGLVTSVTLVLCSGYTFISDLGKASYSDLLVASLFMFILERFTASRCQLYLNIWQKEVWRIFLVISQSENSKS